MFSTKSFIAFPLSSASISIKETALAVPNQATSINIRAQQLMDRVGAPPLLPLWRSSPDRRCDDLGCPLNQRGISIPHYEGIYKHEGASQTKNTTLFGISNPPPFIWKASRIWYKALRGGEAAKEEDIKAKVLVELFLYIHGQWPNGMPVDNGFHW